jgi:CMP-N-acetylneuraminic acid synthetase
VKLDFAESVMENSCFELLTIDGDTIKANWKSALLNQLEIKEAMENIVNEDQIPTFVVWADPTY